VYAYEIVGPDGDAQGITFDDETDGQEHAAALNGAFRAGAARAVLEGREP
jgi:hypothetical protein